MAVSQHSIESAAKAFGSGLLNRTYTAYYDAPANASGVAGTYGLSTAVPKGFLVTNIRTEEKTAMAGGTNVTFKIAAQALTTTIVTAAFTGVDIHALTSVDGLLTTTGGEITVTTVGTYSAGRIAIYIEGQMSPAYKV